jgi:hypothetical protein
MCSRGIGRNCWTVRTDMKLPWLYSEVIAYWARSGDGSWEIFMQLECLSHQKKTRDVLKSGNLDRERNFGKFNWFFNFPPNSDSKHPTAKQGIRDLFRVSARLFKTDWLMEMMQALFLWMSRKEAYVRVWWPVCLYPHAAIRPISTKRV